MASLLTEHDEKEHTFEERKLIMHLQNIQQLKRFCHITHEDFAPPLFSHYGMQP